eukprot:501057_1
MDLTSRNLTSAESMFKHKPDVIREVSQWLSVQDRYKSLVPVSKLTYRASHSELQDIHQLDSIITSILQTNRTNTTQLKTLSALEHKLRYSELFVYVRDHNMRKLSRHFHPLQRIFGQHQQFDPALNTLLDVFHALWSPAITLEEYNQLSFPCYSNETALKAKVLILSCRSQAIWTAPLNVSEMRRMGQIDIRGQPMQFLVHFPWDTYLGQIDFASDYYFSLVYEYCWDTFASELGIPTFDALFHSGVDSNATMKQLEDLMSRYGLKIQHKQHKQDGRERVVRGAASKKISLAKTFMRWICKIDVLGDIIFDGYGNPNTTPLRNDLMTVFILHLGYQMRHHPEYKDSCVRHLYHPPLDDLLAGFTAHAEHIVSELQSYHFAKGNITTCHELLQICSDLKRAAHGMVPMFRGQHW